MSEEPGAGDRGGLLRPAREGMWVDEFWAAAVALQPGEISGVVESTFGFHVLRLEDKQVVPFVEARDRVAARVAELVPPGPFPEEVNPVAVVDMHFILRNVTFPEAGRYFIRFWGNEHLLVMRPFDLVKADVTGAKNDK